MRIASIVMLLAGCGGAPLLANAPKPDPAVVAGAAAAIAGAATLADPAAAAKRQEENKNDPDDRGIKVKSTVPADVFDRLDDKPAKSTTLEKAPLPPSDPDVDGTPLP